MAKYVKSTIRSIGGQASFVARADSGHWSVIDTDPDDGGAGAASGPMEMVLNALGCCSGIDILLILKKRRTQVDTFEINISAERTDEHPRVFTKVHLEYILTGPKLKRSDIEKAIQLSIDKYCSVAGMVKQTAEITTSFEIAESA